MKKEELLDLITEFKPDDAFVEEALGEREDAPVRVSAGKRSPMRIVAPVAAIAACMAVVIGTGVVASRFNKPETSDNSEERQSVQEKIDPKAFIQVNHAKDLAAIYDSSTVDLTFELEDDLERDFIAECISRIKDENEAAQQEGILWHVNKGYSLNYNTASDSYYFQPLIDGRGIADIGVRVFQKTKGYSSIYGETFDIWDEGSFAKDYEEFDLDHAVDNFSYDEKYYYRKETNGSAERTSIREIYLKGDKQEIAEKTIMEKYVDGDTVTYLREGKKIGEEEFIGIWNTYEYIPKFYADFTSEEVQECREELKESLGLSDSRCSFWRDAEVDIDLDGTNELLILPWEENEHIISIYGTYVFAKTSDGIKQIGSFGTEDYDRSYCNPKYVRYYNESAEECFACYYANDIRIDENTYASYALIKILPDGNGGITTELLSGVFSSYVDGQRETHWIWFGEEVSTDEYFELLDSYINFDEPHKYVKVSVPTNPDNYAWD